MFRSLKYTWNNYWKSLKRGSPSKRAFVIFLRMFYLELKCFFITGYSIDELT